MIREFVYSDEVFYWGRTGNQPTVLETRCTLAQDVEPQALGEALLDALRAHTNFRVRPLVVRSKLLASIEDVKNPPLYEDTGIGRRLGTRETERLMLYVTYKKKVVTLHVFHGLADLRGIYAFLNTLLRCYFNNLGLTKAGLPSPTTWTPFLATKTFLGVELQGTRLDITLQRSRTFSICRKKALAGGRLGSASGR